VCGYSGLEHPPQDFTICPSCATEFELDDEVKTHEELRLDWLSAGAPWFDISVHPPAGWAEYRAQLVAAALTGDATSRLLEATSPRRGLMDLLLEQIATARTAESASTILVTPYGHRTLDAKLEAA